MCSKLAASLMCLLLVFAAYVIHANFTSSPVYSSIYNSTLRPSPFWDWIASIFRPPGSVTISTTTTTTTASTPQRECPDCKCGTINTFQRIVGGQETEVHQYPWMALLLYHGDFYCGASLINDNYVTTAAHCVRGFSQKWISVRLLEHNRQNSSVKVIDRRAAWIGIHENYSSRTYDSDIALIRFSEPIQMNELLRPVCMPAVNNSFAGEIAVVTGWGALSEGGPISDTLQEVEVPILSQEDCRRSNYGASSITDNMICAGYDEGNKDSCQGDSGGPLHVVVNDTQEYQLAGIVSWGEGCAKPRSPGVYTRVNHFNDWIAENTRDACTCQPATTMEETTTSAAFK